MPTMAILNIVFSALAAGLITFVTATTAGATVKVAISSAVSAALVGAVQHLRGSPIDPPPSLLPKQ